MTFWVWWLVVASLLALPPWASAATRYVQKSGSSDGNPCTQSQPCLTVNRGRDTLQAGDTLFIGAGVYAETLGVPAIPNGSSGAPTIIRGEAGTILRPNTNVDFVILLRPSQHDIVVDTLDLDGSNGSGTRMVAHVVAVDSAMTPSTPAQRITVTNSRIHHARHNGFLIAGSQWTITHNEIHHNAELPDVGGNVAHGVYFQCDNSLVADNHIHNNGAWGLQIFSSAGFGPTNNTIVRNRFEANGDGGITAIHGGNHLIANNAIWGSLNEDSGAIVIAAQGRYYNNTLYGNQGAGMIACCDMTLNSNHIIRNNLAFANSTGNFVSLGNATQSNNVACNAFINPPTNLQLQPGLSCAIDQGATLTDATPDLAGVARPQGQAYDVGAYESGGGAGNTPPSVQITHPTTQDFWAQQASPLVNLGGVANDSLGQVSSVSWSCLTCTPRASPASGTGAVVCTNCGTASATWTVASIGVDPGDNVLTVAVTDNQGATATDQITIRLPTVPSRPTNLRFVPTVTGTLQTIHQWDHTDLPGDAQTAAFRLYHQASCAGGFLQVGSDLGLTAGTVGTAHNGLTTATPHCWHVKAVSATGQESLASNQVRWDPPVSGIFARLPGAPPPLRFGYALPVTTQRIDMRHPHALGLRHYWRGTRGLEGGRTWYDVVRNGYGVLTNVPVGHQPWQTPTRPGAEVEVLFPTGSAMYVAMETQAGVTGPFTASLWVKEPPAFTQDNWVGLIGQVTDFGWNTGWGMFLDDAQQLACFVEDDIGSRATVTGAFHPTSWTHLACVWDTQEVKVYVDGVLAASVAHTTGFTLGHPLWVGTLAGPTGGAFGTYWQGWLSDVALFDQALSPADVAAWRQLQLNGDDGLRHTFPAVPLPALATNVAPPPSGPHGTRGGATGFLLRR